MHARGGWRALAVGVVVALGACSSGGDEGGDDGRADASGTSAPAVSSDVSNDAELEQALLTLDDLPDGMVDVGLGPDSVEVCGMRTEMPDAVGAAPYRTAGDAFSPPDQVTVPEVFQKFVVVPAGVGAEAFGHVRAHLDGCGTGGEVDGILERGVADLPVPALGDESLGRRLTVEVLATGATMDIDVLYAREGDTIVAVGVVVADGRSDLLPALATTAFDRAAGL